MPRWLFVTILEIAMVAGCLVAAFTVPPTTPLRTFLLICAGAMIFFNALLFIKFKKAATSDTLTAAENKTNTGLWTTTGLMFLYLLWQLLKRWK
jgi:hypothetical protein